MQELIHSLIEPLRKPSRASSCLRKISESMTEPSPLALATYLIETSRMCGMRSRLKAEIPGDGRLALHTRHKTVE